MASTAGAEFTGIFTYNGSSFTDVTLEAQSPAGTAFSILGAANHFLYLGHDSKFDLAIFDVDVAGEVGALTWQFYRAVVGWQTFVPSSARYQIDPDDDEGSAYDFSKDGAEIFPPNILQEWTTFAVNSLTKYWIRVSTASASVAPTIKRVQMRPYAAYCSTKDVFNLLQMGPVLGGTDFTSSTVPSKSTVEQYILEAQSYVDMGTRKSWRPNYIINEYQQFNLNGFKLDKPDPYKLLDVQIWNGANWESKRQGRTKDYFLVPDTGMVHFSRYFLLPARFTSYNAPVWRWGGGEFTMPVKVTYLTGRDIQTDIRQGGMVTDITKKLAAIDVMQSADFGGAIVGGMDRIDMANRVANWKEEIADNLDSLKAFEVF